MTGMDGWITQCIYFIFSNINAYLCICISVYTEVFLLDCIMYFILLKITKVSKKNHKDINTINVVNL